MTIPKSLAFQIADSVTPKLIKFQEEIGLDGIECNPTISITFDRLRDDGESADRVRITVALNPDES